MPEFSQKSKDILDTCDKRLRDICNEAIKTYDFSVICGHRGKEAQDAAVAAGNSHTPWPTSKHNSTPSLAVDLIPYPFRQEDWNDIARFTELASHMLVAANKLKIPIRWGGSFTKLKDFDHFELVQ